MTTRCTVLQACRPAFVSRFCQVSSSTSSSAEGRRLLKSIAGRMSARMKSLTFAESATATDPCLKSLDAHQVKLLEEECILVDEQDRVIGTCSKKDCHLMANIDRGLLHRAFSVFLFNSSGELLIQQRSDGKITFPGCYTNTCCSHPLAVPTELTENPVVGVKRAAQRRMFIELGIPPEELSLDSFHYLTRIRYKAASSGTWGEHEIDYILVVRTDLKTIEPNLNEVKSICFVGRDQIDQFFEKLSERGESLTPWFQLVVDTFLKNWWTNLDCLDQLESHDVVHNLV